MTLTCFEIIYSQDMVQLHLKKGDESQFLVETTVQVLIDDLMKEIVPIYNGRLKVERLCAGM